jgi:antitoxin (DNA-binding transcriptional repressor) of toxin-antitoxin stability system
MRYVEKYQAKIIVTDMGKPVVNIVPHEDKIQESNLYALRGTLLKYDNPLEPVDLED